jgi:mono/diheme cytochrome c family protein
MSLKIFVPAIATAICLTALSIVTAGARANTAEFDAAKTYKSKCVACHGAKAEKKYDPAKPDDEQVQAILKGKKGEKPPNMPEYATKGVTEEQAKALVAHMKSLRP